MQVDATTVTVNGRTYHRPDRPLIVVCVDGCEPAYLDEAITAGATPFIAGVRASGTYRLADCVLPSFTNPNNVSIVTGAPPSVGGSTRAQPRASANTPIARRRDERMR